MKLPRRTLLHLAAGAAVLPSASLKARAQAYPSRPVRMIVGFAAGGRPIFRPTNRPEAVRAVRTVVRDRKPACPSRKFRPHGLGNMRENRRILHCDVGPTPSAPCSCLRPFQVAAPDRDRKPVFAPSVAHRVISRQRSNSIAIGA
jgi:hypothetical protein